HRRAAIRSPIFIPIFGRLCLSRLTTKPSLRRFGLTSPARLKAFVMSLCEASRQQRTGDPYAQTRPQTDWCRSSRDPNAARASPDQLAVPRKEEESETDEC